MSKIFEFRPGSYIDLVSGAVGVNTNGEWARTEKGLAWRGNGVDAKVEFGNLGNVRSLVFGINLKTLSEQIFEGDPNAHLILSASGTLSYPDFDNAYVDGVYTNTITTGWHLLIVTSSTDVNCSDAVLALNNTSYGKLDCCLVKAFDAELTEQERAKLYQEFLRASPTSKIVEDNVVLSKPTDLSNVNGLVAAYNMIPNGDTLVDISGNGNNGNITPKGESGNGDGVVISTSEGLLCNGSGVIMLSSKNAVDVWSVAWRSKFKDTGAVCYFIGRSYGSTVGNIGLSASEKIIFRENSGAYTIHSFTETIQYDKWYDFVMVSNGTQVALYISGVLDDIITPTDTGLEFEAIGAIKATIDSDIEFADYRQFNYAFTQEQAEQYHNSFQKLEKRGNFSLHPVGSTI